MNPSFISPSLPSFLLNEICKTTENYREAEGVLTNACVEFINVNFPSYFFFVFLPFSWATPTVYGGFQARGLIGAVATGLTPQPQQHGIQATSATYTTAHGNAGSLTH